jgi:hypothetical protein
MNILPLVAVWLVAGQFSMSDQTNGQLWNCHIPEKQLKVLSVDPYQVRGYTFDVFRFDRNSDGAQDMLLMYVTANGKRSTFPKYYMYDTDYNGKPDKAYVDTQGNGICQQMQELDVTKILAEQES